MAKSGPAKVSVECPYCGFRQMEYAAAKSTMCRQCGRAFAPGAPSKVESTLRAAAGRQPAAPSPLAHSLLDKLEGLWSRTRNATVECFECKAKQEVISTASSTICPKCSAHLDLRDYKITTGFSRAIRTHGKVHVTAKGDLSSSQVVCQSVLIEGKVRCDLHCLGTATVNFSGKIPGRIYANHIVVARKSRVQFFRRVRAKSFEIRGQMDGEVIAETVVIIHRKGSLDGNVTAKSISVEKGGMFSGRLMIGSSGLKQGELLPAQPASAGAREETVLSRNLEAALTVT